MFSGMNSPAIDEGLSAFLRAIAIMRRNPRVLNPVLKVVAATVVVLAGLFLCTMFFGRDLDAMTVATILLVLAFASISHCAVIEFVTTIAMSANVRLGFPRLPGDVRNYAKARLADSLRAQPLATTGFIACILVMLSSTFFVYLFAAFALATVPFDTSVFATMLFSQFTAVCLSSFCGMFTVMTGRFIIVHKLAAREAFAKARECISHYRPSVTTILIVNVVMGTAQGLLAFLALADHVQVNQVFVDVFAFIVSVAMFSIIWIVQVVPYIALTERRSPDRF